MLLSRSWTKNLTSQNQNASSVIGQILFIIIIIILLDQKNKKNSGSVFRGCFSRAKKLYSGAGKKKKVEEIRILNVTYIPYFC